MEQKEIEVFVAGPEHEAYVDTILQTIADAAKVRGTGIAKRTHEYLATKMKEAKAVIALCDGRFAGFSYSKSFLICLPVDRLSAQETKHIIFFELCPALSAIRHINLPPL